MKKNIFGIIPFLALFLCSCGKDENGPMVRFKLRFDQNQARLDNFGQPAIVPAGHATQTPRFKGMGVHYIEFSPNASTALGAGAVLYRGTETTKGGGNAIDFPKTVIGKEDSVLIEIPIKDINAGTYNWIRVSANYLDFDINFNLRNMPIGPYELLEQNATIASWVDFNTYLGNFYVGDYPVSINANKQQGYCIFDPDLIHPFYQFFNSAIAWQISPGGTTVVNPLFASSPIPANSGIVTGALLQPLVLTGQETEDIEIVLSFSTNNSFEWIDKDNNGTFDIYYDTLSNSDEIIDTGLRGLMAEKQ